MTKHLTHAVRIQKARTALLLDHPFFGSLLFRLGGRASTRFRRWPRMASPCSTTRHSSRR